MKRTLKNIIGNNFCENEKTNGPLRFFSTDLEFLPFLPRIEKTNAPLSFSLFVAHFSAKSINSFIPWQFEAILFAANRLFIHVNTVRHWVEKSGNDDLVPRRKRGMKRTALATNIHMDFLIDHLRNNNAQLFLSDMVDLIWSNFGIKHTVYQIRRGLKFRRITHKVLSFHAREQNVDSRLAFRNMMRSPSNGGMYEAQQLLFVDETHSDLKSARRKYGWALRGYPAYMHHIHRRAWL